MKRRIVLHIGLPKTATSTLQKCVFPKFEIRYLGVNQPRDSEQDSVYTDLLEYTSSEYASTEALTSLRKKITSLITDDEILPLVISEEMFCIDEVHVSWQNKVERLGRVFSGFNIEVLVTVRKPLEAMYSLYVELFNNISHEYTTFDEFFYKCNNCKIYEYKYFSSVLEGSFAPETIKYFPFEGLVDEELFITELGKMINVNKKNNIKLDNINAKKEDRTGYKTSDMTIGNFISRIHKISLIRWLSKLSFIQDYIKPHILPMLKIKVRKGAVIERYTERESSKYIKDLNESNEFFYNHFDIDYR